MSPPAGSPQIGSPPAGSPGSTGPAVPWRSRRRDRITALAFLVVVWMLLWGVFSWGTFLSGLLVASLALVVFPLPPVTFAGRVHPVGMARFAARFLVDLVVASVQLAWTAFRFGYEPRSAVVRVPLAVRSDLNLTLCGEAVSLIPGSLIIDTDRAAGILYIHVFNVADRDDVERFRRGVYDLEARIVRAVGSAAEREQLQRASREGRR